MLRICKGAAIIAKTEITTQLERNIWSATKKQGVFGCFEVTIGWFGKERVDFLTYDTKGVWRCYEIKISKSDFHSKSHNTFLGHFNYFVMTKELYEQVKEEVPAHIGVFIKDSCVKRAKRQGLGVDEQILKNSMIRSLCREVDKQIRSGNPLLVESLNRQIDIAEKEADRHRQNYWNLLREVHDKYGTRWNKEKGAQGY